MHDTEFTREQLLQELATLRRENTALKKRERQFRAMVENSVHPIVLYDLAGTVLAINHAAAQLVGLTAEECVGKRLEALLSFPDAGISEHMRKMVESGEPLMFEVPAYPRGEAHWFSIVLQPLRDDAGQVDALHGIAYGIAAPKHAAQSVRALLDAAQHIALLIETDGTLLAANEVFAQVCGIPRDELLGTNAYDLLDPETREGRRQRNNSVVASGRPARYEGCHRGRCFDNSVYPIPDDSGKVTRLAIYTRDVTAQREIERAHAEIELTLNKAEEIAGIGSFFLNLEDDALIWSTNMYALVGIDRDIFAGNLGEVMRQVIHPDDRAHIAAQIADMLRQRRTWPMTFRIIWPDGEMRWVGAEPEFVFTADGRPVRAIGLHYDITAQVRYGQAVQDSEPMFGRVFQAIPDAALLWQRQLDGEIVLKAFNDAAVIWSEGRAAQFLAKPLEDFFEADGDVPHHIRHTFDSGEAQRLQVHSRSTITDTESWGIANYTKVSETLLLHIVTDITDRVEAEQAKQTSETRFRALFENAAVGIAINDITNRRLARANARLQAMLGYNEAELQARDITALIHPDDLPAYLTEIDEIEAKRLDLAYMEKRAIHKDGHPVWLSLSIAVVCDTDGQPGFCATIAEDITEYKQAEAALRASEQRYRLLAENIHDVIWTTNNDFRLTFISPSVRRLLGYEPEEALAMSWKDLISPGSYASAREVVREQQAARAAQRIDQIHQLDVECVHRDGSTVWCEVTSQPLLDESGQIIGVLVISRDISARKRLEAQFLQAQKMEAVGRLASGVAHDFNNILTVIGGCTDLLLTSAKDHDPGYTDLREIKKATERATGLTHQLLAFSRQQVLQLHVLNLNELIENLIKMLRRMVGEDIEVNTCLAADLYQVEVDPGQMEQVIMNLVVNARQAMPDGGRLVIATRNASAEEVRAPSGPDLPAGHYALLSVSDCGIGMDEETLAHIFEPFFTTRQTGTGLGLATVYGIVTQSGGEITVASKPQQGTTFSIYLPAVQRVPVPQPPRPAVSRTPAPGTETVLLVEDEDSVRNLASRVLRNDGYTVLAAADGEQALHICHTHDGPLDLLLTDVVLSHQMNGLQVAEAVAALRPGIRVVFTSGYPAGDISQSGIAVCNSGVLQKPFTTSDLLSHVRAALDA